LVTANVTKHLMFSFQPTDRVFPHTLYVFPLDAFTAFAVLQSRIHERWARLLSSSLEDRLRYSASDCFETFPFPTPDPRAVLPAVEAAGERFYATRAAFMVETQQGLTKTYNALKDPENADARVLELRALHEAVDRAVLEAYGWSDLAVPPYCPITEDEQGAAQRFEAAIIDRLFALNAERAAAEQAAAPTKQKAAGKTKASANKKGAAAAKGRGKKTDGPKLPGVE
jgi:hypothetical protein